MKRLCIALVLCAGTVFSAHAQQPCPLLRFSNPTVNLDTLRYDCPDTLLEYRFENISTGPVSIIEVRSQCGCFTGEIAQKEIPVGGVGMLRAKFSPATLHGPQNRHLTVLSSNGKTEMLSSVSVVCFVLRDISEGEIRFPEGLGEGLRTDRLKYRTSMDSMGDYSCSIALYNDTDAEVSVTLTSKRGVKIYCPKTIPPRARVTANVIVRPGRRRGDFSRQIAVRVNGRAVQGLEIHGTFK